MQHFKATVEAQMERQRWIASQSAREVNELDPRSVLLVAQQLIAEGDEDGARTVVAAYRASLRAA